EVFDVLTGKRLSARSCANVFIFQNRPPFLVLPQNGVQVDRTNPQNIVFQWTPRQLNVTHVEYELSLVELWDNTIDPQAAFLATPPIFQTTTRATSYLYDPAHPVLLPDHAYAWRVRAKAVDGTEAIGQFENQGYSEIFSFVHLAPCELPPNLRHEVRGSGQANILWDDPSTEVPEFTVRYRQKGEGNAWFLNRTNANWTTLWDLRPGMPYEYQLKKDCGLGESGWSTVRQFTTALETEGEELYQCGISPGIDIQNEEPLPSLLPGQQFTAGDFTVIVTQVNGGEGYYSGKGYVRIPYLGNIKLAVYFDNVLLNTDRKLLQGTVITEYDPTMRNIVDTGDVVETVGELAGAIAKTLEELFDQLLNAEIDKTTRQNIENLTELLVEQAKAELPKPLANAIEDASNRMVGAKEKYDTAIQNGNQAMASEAENEFASAQNDLREAEDERDDFIEAYASIIEEALRQIVIESNDRLENGLEGYGEESIVEKVTNESLELSSNDLDQISEVMEFEETQTSEQEQIDHFEYERWTALNYIATNLQTDEGTTKLGNLLKNEGETLGVYIYTRLNQGKSNEELTTETKELIIQIISEKIALTLELF
ncbi:MAG: fibronectin type III domain-containing protein, partial [Bacteroidota bacterium]